MNGEVIYSQFSVPLLKHKLKRESGSRNLSGVVSQMGDEQKRDLCTSLSHIILMACSEHTLALRHANPINPARERSLQFFTHTHTKETLHHFSTSSFTWTSQLIFSSLSTHLSLQPLPKPPVTYKEFHYSLVKQHFRMSVCVCVCVCVYECVFWIKYRIKNSSLCRQFADKCIKHLKSEFSLFVLVF